MRGRATLMAIGLLGLGSSELLAAKAMKIVYHHATAVAASQTLDGKHLDSQRLVDGQALDIRGAKKVAVWIDDPNPVLFTYKWEDPTYAPNADYAAALGFAKAAQPIQGLLPKPSPGKEARVRTGVPFNDAVEELKLLVKSMPEIARLTLTEPDEAKRRVNAWALVELEQTINEFYEKLRSGDLSDFTGQQQAGESVLPTSFREQPAAGSTAASGSAGAPTPTTASGIPVTTGAQPAATPPAAPAAPAAASGDSGTREGLRALAQEQPIRTMLASAKKFARDVRAVNMPVQLGELSYDVTKNATANVFIAPVPEFQAIATESGRAIGKISIPTQPYWPVHLSFAPAVVYSFIDTSDFSTEVRDDGKFNIVEKEGDVRGTNASAMLTITPRGWDEPTFGGGFQVGVSPVKDQIGLFAGGFFRVSDLLSLALGYGYQQVPRLKDGLTLDTPLDAPGDLKTEPEFEGGFWVGINISLPK